MLLTTVATHQLNRTLDHDFIPLLSNAIVQECEFWIDSLAVQQLYRIAVLFPH